MSANSKLRECALVFVLCLLPSLSSALTNISSTLPNSFTNINGATNSISYAFTITNNDSVPTNLLRTELWAFAAPYQGGALIGVRTLSNDVLFSPLQPGRPNTQSLSGFFIPPPNGTYYFSLVITEQQNAASNDGYITNLYYNFSNPITYGPAAPVAITPQLGLWWNAAESGTGYAIDYKHGVLVMTVYSYTAAGAPIWYLVAGPVVNNTATLTLDKYTNGQCISCPYVATRINGNDGQVTVKFTSATTATLTLPGGRNVPITPQPF